MRFPAVDSRWRRGDQPRLRGHGNNIRQRLESAHGQPGARLEAYSQFSSDTLVRIPYGEIRSVLNPRPFLEEKYIEHVSAYNPAWAEDLKDKSNDPNAAIQVPEEVKEEVTNES